MLEAQRTKNDTKTKVGWLAGWLQHRRSLLPLAASTTPHWLGWSWGCREALPLLRGCHPVGQRRQLTPPPTCASPQVMGKNKPTRRHRKKQQNVIDDRNPVIRKRIAEQEARKAAKAAAEEQAAADEAPRALQRFYKR
jgi:hypothetical protein